MIVSAGEKISFHLSRRDSRERRSDTGARALRRSRSGRPWAFALTDMQASINGPVVLSHQPLGRSCAVDRRRTRSSRFLSPSPSAFVWADDGRRSARRP
jgi:hypothetical protein